MRPPILQTLFVLLIPIAVASAQSIPADVSPARPSACLPWPATDALGRHLPGPDEVGPPCTDRFVGIFYFLWHTVPGNRSEKLNGPYDVAKILAIDPDAPRKPDSPLWGPAGMSHYWGEPLYGYYLSTDPWVLRRHAHLLADAGIDTLIFDTTNAVTYREVFLKLCEVYRQIRQEGDTTPQFAFMVNTEAGKTAQQIYKELYQPGLFKELWFHWQGKPLLICDPAQASPELQKFFTLRRAHWPFEMINTRDAWHWEATYPQPYGFHDDPQKPEQVNVSVAQNLRAADGVVTNMSDGNARGRSFHDGKQDSAPGAVDRGPNFQEQWKRAFDLKAPFVMVTGWNEWIAGRWPGPNNTFIFVDQYDQQFSRDIEPMKGGHGDNYYWQLIANVRRYKGAAPLPKSSAPTTVRMADGFAAWQDVQPEYRDHVGETIPRDFKGVGGLHYTNRTGRNDIAAAKVARDRDNVYFYVRTREPITPPNGVSSGGTPASTSNWMWLLIDADNNQTTGWEGYDFILNRTTPGADKSWLERNTAGWKWQRVAQVRYQVEGRELEIAVPRTALNLPANTSATTLNFKWADNVQTPGNILDFYQSGDVAPEARFLYHYAAD